jgi:hypothetical protein
MRIMWHIFAKDLRRLRWPLVAWIAIVIARVVTTAFLSELAFTDFAWQFIGGNVSALFATVDVLMLALLVSGLVHDEPLLGPDAFWLTRPIRPTTLLTAKLVFAGVFLIAVPAVGQSVAVAAMTRTAADALRVIPSALVNQGLWVVAFVAIATLTPSPARFAVALVGSVATLAIAGALFTAVLILTAEIDSPPGSPIADRSGAIVGSCLWAAVALMVIVCQYRTRRVRQALFAGIAGMLLSAAIVNWWPWPFAKAAEPDLGPWARDAAAVHVELDRNDEPYVVDDFAFRRHDLPRKLVAAPVRVTGVPPAYGSQSTGVRTRLEFPDGTVLQSTHGSTVGVRRESAGTLFDQNAQFRAALGTTRLLMPRSPEAPFSEWPVVLAVTDADYQRLGRRPGRLTATIDLFLRDSRVIGSLPLMEGAALRGRSRFEIRRVARRPDGCTVLIREGAIGSNQIAGTPFRFVLRNQQRGEAVLGAQSEPLGNRELQFGSATLQFLLPWLRSESAFQDHVDVFPWGRGMVGMDAPSPIDASWLDGADLLVIEMAYAGRLTRSFAVDGFTMRR